MNTSSPNMHRKVAGLASLAVLFFALAGVSSQAMAANAVDRSANRVSKDRWARTESSATHSSPDSEGSEDAPIPKARSLPPSHIGELNGDLHFKSW